MVQIDNMEIPKNCFDCDLNYECCRCAITGTGYFENEQFNPSEEILSDCPLREVPPVRKGHWIEPGRHGNWIYDEKAYRECGRCHKPVYLAKDMRYCPFCGSQNYDDEEWLNILISKPYLKCEEDGEQNGCLHDISKNC